MASSASSRPRRAIGIISQLHLNGDVEAAEKKATPAVHRLFDLYRNCTVTKPTDRPDMAEVAQSLERHILDVLLTNEGS